MTETGMVPPTEWIVKAIENGIRSEIEREFEDAKKRAIEALDRRKAEVVAGILISMMKQTDFRIAQDRFVFTIKTDSPSKEIG